MEFISNLIDDETAPTIIVDGVARVERPSKNKIHVVYYRTVRSRNGWVQKESLTQIWDRDNWLRNYRMFVQAQLLVETEPPAIAGEEEHRPAKN